MPTIKGPFDRATPAILIDEAADPRIAAYASLRERDLTGGHGGRFIIEGRVALETQLMRGRFALESVFVCETRIGALRDLLARLPESAPVYTAPQGVMDAIAGFAMHRGVLACGLKGAPADVGSLITAARAKPAATLLIASDLSNHDNIGALFRNAAAFGAEGVLLDARCCDPLYRKAIRVSSGASLWLPFHQGGDAQTLMAEIAAAGFEIWTLTPRPQADTLAGLPVPDHLAIMVGAEGPGLPDHLIASGKPVRIAMQDGFDSVNVATAAAIALSHVFNARA